MAIKSYNNQILSDVDKQGMYGPPSDEDYAIIKNILNSDIPQEQLFVYPVLLIDNDINTYLCAPDHDALMQLSKIFDEKHVPGLHDHEWRSENMHSTTYKTKVVVDNTRKNKVGEDYEYLIGYEYTINNENHKNLIEDIKAAIKKGASIGFDCKVICSVCGINKNIEICGHELGIVYDSKLCYGIYRGVTNVDEWSFVPVPAHKNAGLNKENNCDKEDNIMEVDIKKILLKAASNLSSEESSVLLKAYEAKTADEKEKMISGLKAKINELEIGHQALAKENEELKIKLTADAKANAEKEAFDGLTPVNDKAKDMALEIIKEYLKPDQDGNISGALANEELKKNYSFLFKDAVEESTEEDNEELEDSEVELEDDDEEASTEGTSKSTLSAKPKAGAQFSVSNRPVQKSNTSKQKYTAGVKVNI